MKLSLKVKKGEKQIAYTIAEGKFPKKPGDGNLLEACRKDFRNFKNNINNKEKIFLNERHNRLVQNIVDSTLFSKQNESIEKIMNLLKENKEDVAFSMFFRTFPSCLPHRSQR